jgi:hypothetical protein
MSNESKVTNQAIANNLEQIANGTATGGQLVFDPVSGEFKLPGQGQQVSPDATTINSIARDGFAKKNI